MRIVCRDCRTDFALSTEGMGMVGIRSSCPSCRASFRLIPSRNPAEPPEIVFEGGKESQRTCVNCSREFDADPREAVPICPSCRQEKETEPEAPAASWKIFRNGRPVELDGEAAVREWIRQGEILPDDLLVAPSGRSASAKRFGEFREALKSTAGGKEGAPASRIRNLLRGWYRPTAILKTAFLLSISFAMAWAIYRAATYAPPVSEDGELLGFVEGLRRRHPAVQVSPDLFAGKARAGIAMDSPERIEEAIGWLEEALIASPSSPGALGSLAESYGLLASFRSDTALATAGSAAAALSRRLYPQRPDGEIARGRASLALRDLSSARSAAENAALLDPENERVFLLKGQVLLAGPRDRGSLNQAVELATRAIKRNPDLLEAYDILAQAHSSMGEPRRAYDACLTRLKRSPQDPLAPFRMGEIEARGNRFGYAKERYQAALRADARLVNARVALGVLLDRIEGKPDLAERHFREVLGRYRAFSGPQEISRASRGLLTILLRSGRFKEAAELARPLPTVGSESPDLSIAQARALDWGGALSDAVNSLENRLESHPDEAEVAFALATIHERNQNVEESIRRLRGVIGSRPSWILPYFHLIRLLIQGRRTEEAMDVANAVVTRSALTDSEGLWIPPDRETEEAEGKTFLPSFRKLLQEHPESAVVHALIGLAHFQSRENPEALRAFERARGLAPSIAFPRIYAARTLLALGNPARAIASLKAAIAIQPNASPLLYWMGSACVLERKWEEAKSLLSPLTEDSAVGPRAMHLLGTIALAQGDRRGAEIWWRKSLEREPRQIESWNALLDSPSD